ncbi:hypothetical protein [Demequina iriomotensis]|uniref:hypothetical protein n=1 Tax=Demequina iriomotensis TaxID=1536641 RepID=UPI000784C849|nr:hypothetical protein [Demequina iriomotensis]
MTITTTRARSARAIAAVLATAAAVAVTVPAGAATTATTASSTAAAVSTVQTAVPTALQPSDVRGGTKLWVTGKRLKLRERATNDSAIAVVGYTGARAVATGKKKGGWVQVKMAGITAWAPARFFATSKPSVDTIVVGTTGKNLGVRKGDSNSTAVVTYAKRGTTGTFTGVEAHGWWQVKINGVYGWTPERFLNVGGYYDREKLLKLEHSQVGYREPSWRTNKFNAWIDGHYAWCHVFVEWSFAHAGYASGVPYRKHFDKYVEDLRRAGVLDTTPTASDLKRGDVVLVDWYPYDGPTHTGTIDHVDGNTVWLVEGNTVSGTGSLTRGVWYRQRALADIYAVYDPTDYARATMQW